MIVKKETTVNAITSDGEVMVTGKTYIFEVAEGKCLCGIYQGIGRKGALQFLSAINSVDVRFNVMPGSVNAIYEAEVEMTIPF